MRLIAALKEQYRQWRICRCEVNIFLAKRYIRLNPSFETEYMDQHLRSLEEKLATLKKAGDL